MMKKRLTAVFLSLAMMLSLAACGERPTNSGSESASSGTEETVRSFTDSVGRTVEVPAQIDKVALSGPLAQITIFALCPDKLVGVSDAWTAEAEQYLTPEYFNMPEIGQLYGGKGELNLETLLSSGAQIVIDVGEPKGSIKEDLDALQEQTGIPFVHITATIGTMDQAYRMLGELLGKQKEQAVLPDVQEQSQCSVAGAELKEGQTSPPKSYTEDTLLSAMQAAGADSMPEGVERQGIGTPATRAATIEKLVQKGFLERKGTKKTKVLLPTDKGKALITVMPEEIQSPEMTADWETKLLQIERGEMEPSEFMTEINTMITELVKNTEMKKGVNALMKNKIIGICPNCGANVVEREKGWFCESNPCRFVLWKDNAFLKRLGKRMDAHVADKLLRDGRVRLKDCKSAKGKTYNATVLLSCEADGRSKFSLEFEGGC